MVRRSVTLSLVLVPAVIAAIVGGISLRRAMIVPPPISTTCVDELRQVLSYAPGTPVSEAFSNCIHRQAQIFLTTDVVDTRDLVKAFLTLVTAVLVASITFSEKIIGIDHASGTTKAMMIACWIMFLGAIVAAGVGLAFMTLATGWASYAPYSQFRVHEYRAVVLFVGAGIAFASGLALMLAAGIVSLLHPRPGRVAPTGSSL